MLLESSALDKRWAELIHAASKIDIAVAWLTNMNRVEDLIKFAALPAREVRVVASINDHNNNPECLRRLHEAGLLKIVIRKGSLFHPKLYLFALPDRSVCWIGSANLTGEGFGGNVELMHEHVDDGSAASWFERLWAVQKPATAEWLDEYQEICEKHPPIAQPEIPNLIDPGGPLESWAGYVAELKRMDKKWLAQSKGVSGVYSGSNSHVGTIRLAQEIIREDWGKLSRTNARVLLGLWDEDGTDYGHLGSMQGAGIAKNIFFEGTPKNLKIRREIQDAIKEVLKVPLGPALPLMARKAHEVISNRERFSGGIATRLLALARPEVLVSVNNESVQHLSKWSGLPPRGIRLSTGYEKLIKWVMASPWWKAPDPKTGLEHELWLYRAALIDALAYGGHSAL